MPQRIRAIGIDFDGTLSDGGRPAADTLQSLREARESGRRLLLVTGRILVELHSVFPDVDADLLDALELATSWDAWNRLRTAQGCSVARARRVVERTIRILTEGSAS